MKRILIFFTFSAFAILTGYMFNSLGETDATAAIFFEFFAVGGLFVK